MATGLRHLLDHLQHAGGGLTDGQLLGRFVATRDEESFAALVRRHGPMVLGVCRRVLHDGHDAEDAFQATFLILARKAGSVVQRESLGCWLYQVAYHTALEASEAKARRRARERPMNDVPHPVVAPAESVDWVPLLDRELTRLPEKYRAAIVLCDLEGQTRKEAARLLKVPEGTLSSRLATGRQMLARRLAASGVALAGGALAVALSQGVASAQISSSLVNCTVKSATLVAVGQLAGVSTPAVALMEGVMKAMFLKKLRLVIGTTLVLVAVGAVGLGQYLSGGSGTVQAAPPERPLSELEALKKENELLKLNLQVVLEKVRAQEAELREVRERKDGGGKMGTSGHTSGSMSGPPGGSSGGSGFPGMGGGNFAPGTAPPTAGGFGGMLGGMPPGMSSGGIAGNPQFKPGTGSGGPPSTGGIVGPGSSSSGGAPPTAADPFEEAEAALKALRSAKDKKEQKQANEALDRAMKKLREQLSK
jgi:RNA polymerase sigma factor (sigma-70 family)